MASTLAPVPTGLLRALQSALPGVGAVRGRPIDRLALAHDASHFLLTPAAVAVPADATEVAAVAAQGVSVTFRPGGTSLSGQAVIDGVLADTRRHFRDVQVLDGGSRVRVQPGATIRQVNARLQPFGRMPGPDPASESACTIGGVVENNSSGMACGTVDNACQTLESMVMVLPSGTVLDTGARDADGRLKALEPALYQGLARLRDEIAGSPPASEKIAAQFAMKNTLGYGLNSFTDFHRPVDILAHPMVGSEGTLGFVASAVLRTIPIKPFATTGLLVFDSLSTATGSLPELVASGAATIELLDAASIRVGQQDPHADAVLRRIAVRQHAALLVEYQSDAAELAADADARARLGHVRKGLYASVAGARPSGSTALLEDIVVPVAALSPTCNSLTELSDKHLYRNSVIFGHGKDGNIHFMLTEQLGGTSSPERLLAFTQDMVELVLGHGGSLKAEHGTGRMMASYVRRQYGDELYQVMRQVKTLFDPAGLLNPGVVITDDELAHVRHLKTACIEETEVDRCVECGYCEPVCPSQDLTLTPRQRIVLRREQAAAAGDSALVAELSADYEYAGVDTCSVDGMCQSACPVLINTGDLVRRLRKQDSSLLAQRGWRTAAEHWNLATRGASLALTVANKLPAGGRPRHQPTAPTASAASAVYFPACVVTMLAPAETAASATGSAAEQGVASALAELCARAVVVLAIPNSTRDLCCGTPWKSKGWTDGHQVMRDKVLPVLWRTSRGGELPIVCDASSCTEGLPHLLESATAAEPEVTPGSDGPTNPYAALRVLDVIEFVRTTLLPLQQVLRTKGSLALHPTCSSHQLGIDPILRALAGAVADSVTGPWTGVAAPSPVIGACCIPNSPLPLPIRRRPSSGASHDAYASCNRTCELGMTRATGQQYQHLVELVAWATGQHPNQPLVCPQPGSAEPDHHPSCRCLIAQRRPGEPPPCNQSCCPPTSLTTSTWEVRKSPHYAGSACPLHTARKSGWPLPPTCPARRTSD